MHDPLYELVHPLPDLRSTTDAGVVLVHGLQGFSDAGNAIRATTDHLREVGDAQLIAEFDVDELIDYRSRRPHLRYSYDRYTEYSEPVLQLHALTDAAGRRYLLLSGSEPDLRWDHFTSDVIALAEDLGVGLAVGLGTIPLGVPHTRPTQSSAHANDVDLIRGFSAWPGEFEVPGNADGLLELRLGEHGHRSVGFTVHVPQYLAQSTYPAAALSLVQDLAAVSGLELPTGELERRAAEFTEQIAGQIADNPEISAAVQAMERQFDEFMESQRGSDSLTPGGKPLPSGDEIGAEFERFLAEHSDDEHFEDGPGKDDHGKDEPGGGGRSRG